jgi:hypothetical protein
MMDGPLVMTCDDHTFLLILVLLPITKQHWSMWKKIDLMARRAMGDIAHDGHVAQWHQWNDTPHMRYMPTRWEASTSSIFTQSAVPLFQCADVQGLIETVSHHELFCVCYDLLSGKDIFSVDDLLGDARSTPYLTKAGKVPALRVSSRHKSGFLIPASTWLWQEQPDRELIETLTWLFKRVGYQSTTPPSLSEKLLRSTLPEVLHISRPSIGVRRVFFEEGTQARIDKAEVAFYEEVFAHDENKAYLYHSRSVPSPFMAPIYLYRPLFTELAHYPTFFVQVDMVVRHVSIAPFLVEGKPPQETGEVLTRWLWKEELEDCLEAGYKLVAIHGGYAFREMSGFMEEWAGYLWELLIDAKQYSDYAAKIVKAMMVGVPGRFLREPKRYELVPVQDAQEGDIPIHLKWSKEGDKLFSDYVAHPVYDREATALTPVGDYIKMQCARELYHRMRDEQRFGNKVIKSYVDNYVTAFASKLGNFGAGIGQWKTKRYKHVIADGTKLIGWNTQTQENEMIAPGCSGEARIKLWQKYYKVLAEKGLHL